MYISAKHKATGKLVRGKKERRNVINANECIVIANKLSRSNTAFSMHIAPVERSIEKTLKMPLYINDLGTAN